VGGKRLSGYFGPHHHYLLMDIPVIAGTYHSRPVGILVNPTYFATKASMCEGPIGTLQNIHIAKIIIVLLKEKCVFCTNYCIHVFKYANKPFSDDNSTE
jgi:hypothetical protein